MLKNNHFIQMVLCSTFILLILMADVNGDGLADVIGFADAGVNVSTSTSTGFNPPELWVDAFGAGAAAGGWLVDKHPRMMADVNGDGLADVIGFADAGVNVSTSTSTGFNPPELWVDAFGAGAATGGWLVDKHPRMMADVNGDGLADVIGFADAGVNVSTSTSTGFNPPELWVDAFGAGAAAGGWLVDKHPRMMADVNGDGLADVIGFADAGVNVSTSTSTGFNPPELWVDAFGAGAAAGGWLVDKHPRMMADVNGDGLADVIGFADAGVNVSTSTSTGFNPPELWVDAFGAGAAAGGWLVDKHPRMMADVNGDGLADVIGFADAGVNVSTSTSTGFNPPELWVDAFGAGAAAGGWLVDKHPRMMADVNGDGLADVIGFADAGVNVSTSTSTGFNPPELWVDAFGAGAAAGGWLVDKHPRMMADVNGDGLADVIGFADAGVNVSKVCTYDISNDPLVCKQWALDRINVKQAWTYSQGSSNIVIAVIDSGVDYTHVDLSDGKVLISNDKDYVNNDSDAQDDNGHGTHVAGIAAANTNNAQGIAGICPSCPILPIKVLNAGGQGRPEDVANAIVYSTDQGAKIINLSLGSGSCTDELANAVNYAYNHNVLLVAAAGNACPVRVALGLESFEVNFPAKFERVIAVAATDINDNRASFSSHGSALDISAPGIEIFSTYLNGGYKNLDGTSMAAPMVAGTVGLLLSQNPLLSSAQVQDILQRSAIDINSSGWDDQTGWGRLDAAQAMNTLPISVNPAPAAICPVNSIESDHNSGTEELLTLYMRLRDEVLLSSTLGQRYTGLFYEYGPELANILLTNPTLLDRASQFLQNASDEFDSLLSDSVDNTILSQELYNEANALINDIVDVSDQEFRLQMLQVWEEMELDKYVGQDTRVIWEEMQKEEVYLPMITR